MVETLIEYATLALTVIGGASTIVLGLEKIAQVTPSTKDDLYVGKAKKALGVISDILSKIALNPKK